MSISDTVPETESPIKKSRQDLEAWIDALPDKSKAAWVEGYLYLRTVHGASPHDAMLAVWMSVASYDRGDLKSRDDFSAFIGVSRAVTYQWERRRPQIREWVEELQFMRLHGARLAEVDERTYLAAIGTDGSASDRKLYYERANVLKAEGKLKLVGGDKEDGDSPIEFVNVTDAELDEIRDALERQATSSGKAG
jgi:hypothetical protein